MRTLYKKIISTGVLACLVIATSLSPVRKKIAEITDYLVPIKSKIYEKEIPAGKLNIDIRASNGESTSGFFNKEINIVFLRQRYYATYQYHQW